MADLYLGEFDEIHRPYLEDGEAQRIARFLIEECTEDEAVEYVEDLLILAYIRGRKKAADDLALDMMFWYMDVYAQADVTQGTRMMEVIEKRFEDLNVSDRIREYYQTAEEERMAVVIDTEYHRDHQTGGCDMADTFEKKTGLTAFKTWNTMLDDRVRDTHDYLEGMTVPVSSRFYTYDGDSAREPGDFRNASNNVNCRCFLTYRQGSL